MKNKQMQALLTGPDGLSTALRIARGQLSMQQLADRLTEITPADAAVSKWSSSKVSKIETGQQLPTLEDIRLWADATGVKADARSQWQQLFEDVASKRSMLRRRTGASTQSGSPTANLEAVSALTRTVQLGMIPELLQIEDYSRAVYQTKHVEEDVEPLIETLRERQKALYSRAKTFHFLISEAALRTVRGSAYVMTAQLDRIASAASLPNVTIGILPLGVQLNGPVIEAAFTLFDLDEAVVDDGVESRRYTGAQAARFRELLDAAWQDAVDASSARKLLGDIADSMDFTHV